MNPGAKIEYMPLEEAKAEYEKWDKEIREAKSWGAALTAADEFRRAAKSRIDQLESAK